MPKLLSILCLLKSWEVYSLGFDFDAVEVSSPDFNFKVMDIITHGVEDVEKENLEIYSSGTPGLDRDGRMYDNVEDLWKERLSSEAGGEAAWFSKTDEHWQNNECTDRAVLGGDESINSPDIFFSDKFLDVLQNNIKEPPQFERALDSGAGIGRITRQLLSLRFKEVDLIERQEKYVKFAREHLGSHSNVGRIMHLGVQDFSPETDFYDVIWNQWVFMYLPDEHSVAYLKRCKKGLRKHGVIVVKENVVHKDEPFLVDHKDSSIARSDIQYKEIFRRAGLSVIAEMDQGSWPSEYVPLKMYALR